MDRKVTDADLTEIAKFLPKWKVVARLLGLEGQMVRDIEDRYRDGEDQRLEALMKWVGKDGPQATYRKIYDVLLDNEEGEAAEQVKELTRGKRIRDADIARIAGDLPQWQTVASILGMGQLDIENIETNNRAPADQRKSFLRKWIWKNENAATYEKLSKVLVRLGEHGAAERIRGIATDSLGLKQVTRTVGSKGQVVSQETTWGAERAPSPTSSTTTEDNCGICDLKLKDEKVEALECGHEYHQKCIRPWFEKEDTCPMCRRTVASAQNPKEPSYDAKELYANAMKTGRVKRTVIKCLIVGAAGVGKTSIKHLLLKEELPKKRVSTDMVENAAWAVSISRDVSISRAIANDDDSWHVVRNEKDLRNIIAEIMKAQAKSEATDDISMKKRQIKTEATDIIPNEKPDRKTPATSVASESWIVNSVKPMHTEEDKDFISAIMMAEGGKKFLNTKWIHFIDSGGQPEFHDILPIFVPNTAVVLFVFKLTEGLDEKPKVEYYDKDGKRIGDPHQSYLTHREILEHCLKVFHAQGETCQTIMLIGTHKDCPNQKLITDDLQECLKPFQKKVVWFPKNQPIAMLDCFSKTDENIVQDIREQLLQVVRDVKSEETQDVESEGTPMAWFGLELELKKTSQSETSKHKGILSLEQCKQVADKFEIFRASNGQFVAAMKHFVKYNIFLHYSEVLPDVVFCDPQVLLTMVTQIVHYHYKLKHSQCAVKGDPQIVFRDNAFISAKILSSQYSDNKWVLTSEQFLKLLLHLKIIAPIQTNQHVYYLMPALLPNTSNNELAAILQHTYKDKERLPPLCISFDGGCAPCGVLCSLMATLLQSEKWELCMKVDKMAKPNCLFRNCVTFTYETSTIITLVDFFSHFSIYMYRPKYDQKQPVFPSNIRNEVHGCIRTIADKLSYPNLKFQDAIKCPQHLQDNHVALWNKDNNEYKCTQHDACTGPIPEDHKIWMKNTGHANKSPPASKRRKNVKEAMIEHEVFVKFYADLRKKVHPDDIAAELRAKHLMTENEQDEVTNKTLAPKAKMDHLLSAVEKAILITAENFHIFLDVLANADEKYGDLVKQMKASLQGGQALPSSKEVKGELSIHEEMEEVEQEGTRVVATRQFTATMSTPASTPLPQQSGDHSKVRQRYIERVISPASPTKPKKTPVACDWSFWITFLLLVLAFVAAFFAWNHSSLPPMAGSQ